MSFDSRWNLKWIDAKGLGESPLSFTVANLGCFSARRAGQAVGFTIFEPRDFNPQFVTRLEQRLARDTGGEFDYELVLPDFLKHRADALLTEGLRAKLDLKFSAFLRVQRTGNGFAIRHRLRIVNVDDSPVMLKYLGHTFEGLSYIDIVAQVSDSRQAAGVIGQYKPDLVTMDIQMPHLTGVDVVRQVLAKGEALPIIMISSLSLEDGSLVFEALNAGAFDYVQKPRLEDRTEFVQELQAKMAAAVTGKHAGALVPRRRGTSASDLLAPTYPSNLLWAIGSSTGGTQALTQIFTSMPTSIPPTVIVQHIPPVFSKAFAQSLNDLCPFTVKEAEHGDRLQKDHVYVAAGGLQMSVKERGGELYLALEDVAPLDRFKPSVDYLFRSLAALRGRSIVAGILTGMGRDGAEGLLELKRLGAKTFAQDEKTSAVFGMPRVAIEIGAVDSIAPLEKIAETILQTTARFSGKKAA